MAGRAARVRAGWPAINRKRNWGMGVGVSGTLINWEHGARVMLARLVGTDGQDLLEYGLLAALISTFAAGAVMLLGEQINAVMWQTIAQNF